jgi:hypothetical protein
VAEHRQLFEYALVRVVPRVERGECMNVGVLIWCQAVEYLDLRCVLDLPRLAALDPFLDVASVRTHLDALHQVCLGGPEAGAAGAMSPGERFRWLTAPRSTVVQTSPVHTGVTTDPAAELDHLVELLVERQGPPGSPAV